MHTKFLSENLKGRDHSEDLGVDRRIILDWILGPCSMESSFSVQQSHICDTVGIGHPYHPNNVKPKHKCHGARY